MSISPVRIGIIIATLVTAYFHLSLYPHYGGPDPIVLNGLGYLGLLGAYLLPIAFFQQKHKMIWWVMVGYTVLTLILWVVMGNKEFAANVASKAGYYAKAAELVLLAFLWADKPKS